MARPQATAFGKDAYPDLDAKAAALLHSIARNHALIEGDKRLALAAIIAFYGLNGRRLTLTNGEAYDLVMNVAAPDNLTQLTAYQPFSGPPAVPAAKRHPAGHRRNDAAGAEVIVVT